MHGTEVNSLTDNNSPQLLANGKPKPEGYTFGCPTDYKPEYCDLILSEEFFGRSFTQTLTKTYTTKAGTKIEEPIIIGNEIPTIEEFCWKIGVVRQTVLNWLKVHPEFLEAFTRAKERFRDFIVKNGITSRYEKQFSIFLAVNDTDLKPVTDQVQPESKVSIQVINYYDQRQIDDKQEPMQKVEALVDKGLRVG